MNRLGSATIFTFGILLCLSFPCHAQVVIKGTIRALDGDPLSFDKLNSLLRARGIREIRDQSRFQIFVQGTPRNRSTVRGVFSSQTGAYRLELALNQIDPANKLIDIRLSSIGLPVRLETVTLNGAAIGSQTIDVAMPIATTPCSGHQRWRWRRCSRRWR